MADRNNPVLFASALPAPRPSGDDLAYGLLKGGISAVPYVGSALAELMQVIFSSPIEKRREEWMKRIAEAVSFLARNGLTVESLQSDQRFMSAVFQANIIAQRSHQKEKLDALTNALMNIALGQAPHEVLESIFLGYVDSFTEWHIRILRFFQSPSCTASATELHEVLEYGCPEMKGRAEIYSAVWRDLMQRDLIKQQSLWRAPQDQVVALQEKRTTPHGDEFLKFISNPRARPETLQEAEIVWQQAPSTMEKKP